MRPLRFLLAAAALSPVALAQTPPAAPAPDVPAPAASAPAAKPPAGPPSAAVYPVADSLVADGIPPVPRATAETASNYTDSRPAVFDDWHPTRREMLIGTRFGNTLQIHHVRMPGGARTQVTFFNEPINNAAFEPTKGESFLFTRSVGGNEFDQIYRWDFAAGRAALLTDGTSRNSAPRWSPSGKQIVYSSTRRNKTDTDLYVMNPMDPKSDRMLAEVQGGGWESLDWSPDETKLLVIEYISANESYLWLFDVATGQRTALTPRDPAAKTTALWSGGRFSKDGKGLFVVTDKGGEFQRLAWMDLSTKQLTYIGGGADARWDVDSFDLSRDGTKLAYDTNEDGVAVMHVVEAKPPFRALPAPKLPEAGVVSAMRWNAAGTELGFSFACAHSPADVYSFVVATNKLERWTEGETGGLPAKTFAAAKLVRWKGHDGKDLSGFLYQPDAGKFPGKRPVVINIHGGPEGQARPGYIGASNYYVNELGIAILYPNVRGSSGFGKSFLAADNGYKRFDTYRDIGALLDWVGTQPALDPARVMVTGGSYGGHMTFAVAAFMSDRIRCALPVVGISNLVTFLQNTESYRRDLRRVEYGDERDPDMRAFLERIAPMNNLEKMTAPMFIVQGRNDPRVPYTEAEQIVSTLKSRGTPVWYLLAKDEGHGFRKKPNSDYQFFATIQFVRQHLLDEAPAGPK